MVWWHRRARCKPLRSFTNRAGIWPPSGPVTRMSSSPSRPLVSTVKEATLPVTTCNTSPLNFRSPGVFYLSETLSFGSDHLALFTLQVANFPRFQLTHLTLERPRDLAATSARTEALAVVTTSSSVPSPACDASTVKVTGHSTPHFTPPMQGRTEEEIQLIHFLSSCALTERRKSGGRTSPHKYRTS
ncbi:hypothetical protein E2C01_001944 [Portunus trituberculatus]|uniref:Uncharacterized protein n=1 Tax=Portunus trituberculatus TaxID=210409 RepID=A0A5B7CLQ5_PORTR|nr:hypothetical protein [Portunus trituberculatus]